MQFVRKKAIFVAISMIINTQNRLLEYRLDIFYRTAALILNGYGNMRAGRAYTASGTHLWQKHLTNYCKRRLILPMPFLSYPHISDIAT